MTVQVADIPVLIIHNGEPTLDRAFVPASLPVALMIGLRDYTRIDQATAVDRITNACPTGWQGTIAEGDTLPLGSFRCGTLKSGPGEAPIPLYVSPIA
jgi:hypothetical protein